MARELSLNKLGITGKIVVIGVMALLIGAGYFLVFYQDLSQSIDSARTQEQSLRQDLGSARENEFAYQRDLAELTEKQQRQNQLSKVLPTTTEYPAFLSAIQSVANVSGISLLSWAPQPEVVDKYYARVPMKLELEGRFHQIAKFFYGVGQLDRIINMENITMSDPKQVDKDYVIKVSVLATAFRSLGPTDAPQAKRDVPGAKP